MSAKVLEAPAEDSVRSGLKTSLMRHRCLRSIRRNHRHRRAERDSEFACNERNSRVSAASAMCMKVPVLCCTDHQRKHFAPALAVLP